MRGRAAYRGAAIVTVLAVSALLLLALLAMVSVCLQDLRFGSSFALNVQSEELARAACCQFAQEVEQSQGRPIDWVERLKQPVFPDGASRLGGSVRVLSFRGASSGIPYYSVDNLNSELPASDWTGSLRVPPFTLGLVLETTVGNHKSYYRALLQQRWPYVAVSQGTISLMGTPRMASPGQDPRLVVSPSQVNGNVFCLPYAENTQQIPISDSPGRPMPVRLPDNVFTQIISSRPAGEDVLFGPVDSGYKKGAEVAVGGEIVTTGGIAKSFGNQLRGRVDFNTTLQEDPYGRVEVGGQGEAPPTGFGPNQFTGRARNGRSGPTLQKAMEFPATTDLTELVPAEAPFQTQGTTSVARMTNAPANYRYPPFTFSPGDQKFYLMENDWSLASAPGTSFYYLKGSLGNRYAEVLRPPGGPVTTVEHKTGRGLSLRDCGLFIDGDLELADISNGQDSQRTTSLGGVNSTLIVNGTLILTNASLDALDQGMVLLCRRLVMKASGNFRGLIVVQESALIFPRGVAGEDDLGNPVAPACLSIDGAILCGGGPISLARYVSDELNPTDEQIKVHGLNLWSTALNYDPRYLKSLHRYGEMRLLHLERLP